MPGLVGFSARLTRNEAISLITRNLRAPPTYRNPLYDHADRSQCDQPSLTVCNAAVRFALSVRLSIPPPGDRTSRERTETPQKQPPTTCTHATASRTDIVTNLFRQMQQGKKIFLKRIRRKMNRVKRPEDGVPIRPGRASSQPTGPSRRENHLRLLRKRRQQSPNHQTITRAPPTTRTKVTHTAQHPHNRPTQHPPHRHLKCVTKCVITKRKSRNPRHSLKSQDYGGAEGRCAYRVSQCIEVEIKRKTNQNAHQSEIIRPFLKVR